MSASHASARPGNAFRNVHQHTPSAPGSLSIVRQIALSRAPHILDARRTYPTVCPAQTRSAADVQPLTVCTLHDRRLRVPPGLRAHRQPRRPSLDAATNGRRSTRTVHRAVQVPCSSRRAAHLKPTSAACRPRRQRVKGLVVSRGGRLGAPEESAPLKEFQQTAVEARWRRQRTCRRSRRSKRSGSPSKWRPSRVPCRCLEMPQSGSFGTRQRPCRPKSAHWRGLHSGGVLAVLRLLHVVVALVGDIRKRPFCLRRNRS